MLLSPGDEPDYKGTSDPGRDYNIELKCSVGWSVNAICCIGTLTMGTWGSLPPAKSFAVH